MNRGAGHDSEPAFEHIKLVHSMAGAAVLIYLTDCLVKGRAHGISQIIAAGPAGFQRPKGHFPLLPSCPPFCNRTDMQHLLWQKILACFLFMLQKGEVLGNSVSSLFGHK